MISSPAIAREQILVAARRTRTIVREHRAGDEGSGRARVGPVDPDVDRTDSRPSLIWRPRRVRCTAEGENVGNLTFVVEHRHRQRRDSEGADDQLFQRGGSSAGGVPGHQDGSRATAARRLRRHVGRERASKSGMTSGPTAARSLTPAIGDDAVARVGSASLALTRPRRRCRYRTKDRTANRVETLNL